jgi:pyrroline-5-carboxylate reductase
MTYGFIGTGNMAQTMIKGFINHKALMPEDIQVYDIDHRRQDEAVYTYGVQSCASAHEVLAKSDVLVLAVKPDQLPPVLNQLSFKEAHAPILISLPVGVPMRDIRQMLGFDLPIVRIIPNISAEVFASVTAFCANEHVTADEQAAIIKTLEALGSVIPLPEKHLDIFTVIASSAPAFVIRFSEALAEAALKEGLPKETARKIITDMLLGTARMLREHDPHQLTDRICSPGGTTIVGLTSLTARGFEAAIHKAAADCMKKLTSKL